MVGIDPPTRQSFADLKHRALGRETIEILVGDDPKPFVVHVDIIKSQSKYFQTLLKDGFCDPSDGRLILSSLKPTQFSIYVDWVYFGTPKRLWTTYLDLKRLFVCASFLDDSRFGNAVIDSFIQWSVANSKFPVHLVAFAWDALPPTHKLRQLLIDSWAWEGQDWHLTSSRDLKDGPQEFWVAVSKRQAEIIEFTREKRGLMPLPPWVADRCSYHEHDGGPRCE